MILTLSYRFLSGVKWQFSQKKVLCAQFQGKTLFSHDISNKLLQFNWPNNQTKDRLLFNWNTQFKIYLLENFLVIDRTIMFKFVVESVPKEGGYVCRYENKKNYFVKLNFTYFFPCIQVDEIKTCDILISISRIFAMTKFEHTNFFSIQTLKK